MASKLFKKSVIENQLKALHSAFDALSIGESTAPHQEICRDDARIFAQTFDSDATLGRADAMLSLDAGGAEAFLRAASEFLQATPDGKEVEVDISNSQEKTELGILFTFVLQSLLGLAKKNPERYRQPFNI
jgi:hypothetical protein